MCLPGNKTQEARNKVSHWQAAQIDVCFKILQMYTHLGNRLCTVDPTILHIVNIHQSEIPSYIRILIIKHTPRHLNLSDKIVTLSSLSLASFTVVLTLS